MSLEFLAGNLLLMLLALAYDAIFGWPAKLYRCIRHPVVWIGSLIHFLDKTLNRSHFSAAARRLAGVATLFLVVTLTAVITLLISMTIPDTLWGLAMMVVVTASLLATRSLHQHVVAVCEPLIAGDLSAAQQAVAHIVGRDPSQLDAAGVSRATIETLAENASDGVIAPLFWGVLFGLPGIAAYKAINTLDSMIGHRNERFEEFGWASARSDDWVNLIPARITALLFLIAGQSVTAFSIMRRDAGLHRSPNAGWPESALAGVLGIRLSGPRAYGGTFTEEPWVNGECEDPKASDIDKALRIYRLAILIASAFLLLLLAAIL